MLMTSVGIPLVIDAFQNHSSYNELVDLTITHRLDYFSKFVSASDAEAANIWASKP